jgi:hypothetical protein
MPLPTQPHFLAPTARLLSRSAAQPLGRSAARPLGSSLLRHPAVLSPLRTLVPSSFTLFAFLRTEKGAWVDAIYCTLQELHTHGRVGAGTFRREGGSVHFVQAGAAHADIMVPLAAVFGSSLSSVSWSSFSGHEVAVFAAALALAAVMMSGRGRPAVKSHPLSAVVVVDNDSGDEDSFDFSGGPTALHAASGPDVGCCAECGSGDCDCRGCGSTFDADEFDFGCCHDGAELGGWVAAGHDGFQEEGRVPDLPAQPSAGGGPSGEEADFGGEPAPKRKKLQGNPQARLVLMPPPPPPPPFSRARAYG